MVNVTRRSFVSMAAAGVVAVRAEGGQPSPMADGVYEIGGPAGFPVLSAVSETGVSVSWAVAQLSTGAVEIADNPKFERSWKVKAGGMPLAQLDDVALSVCIEGLRPNTRYWYRTITSAISSKKNPHCAIISQAGRYVSATYAFETLGSKGPSRFAVINDTHARWDSFSFVAKRIKELSLPVVVWNGDAVNCTEDRRTAVEAFLHPAVPTKDFGTETPMLFLPGNHELDGQYARHIDEVMPCRPMAERSPKFAVLKWNFALRQGDIALVGLDTGDGLHDEDRRRCGLGSFSCYRALQTEWLAEVMKRPEISSAPFAVAFCHIPLYNSGPNPNGCETPRDRGCASWIRECNEQWGPILDRNGVQLVVCGHEHVHRWDDETGYRWKQVLGGGPELGYGAGHAPNPEAYPTVIEGAVRGGVLVIRTYDPWHGRIVDERVFPPR